MEEETKFKIEQIFQKLTYRDIYDVSDLIHDLIHDLNLDFFDLQSLEEEMKLELELEAVDLRDCITFKDVLNHIDELMYNK